MSIEDDPKVSTRPPNVWLARGLTAAALLCCGLSLSANHADADLWGHVRYGRDVFQGGLPFTATYTFTAVDYPWINHENLAELAFAAGAATLGGVGLLVLKCLLGVAVAATVLFRARQRGVGLLTACGMALLVSLNLNYFWQMRPQLFSYLYLTLLLLLLEYCFRGWEGSWRIPWTGKLGEAAELAPDYESRRMRCLWLAVPLFFLWANSHGGFAAGVCIYAAYLGVRTIENFACWRGAGFGRMRRFGLMLSAAVAATFLTPYGPRLQYWLIQSLRLPRPEITEWHPPDWFSVEWSPLWLLVAAFAFAVVFTRKSRDLTHLVILSLTLWQALQHQRHVPFFAIPFGLWMAPHVESALRRFRLVSEANRNEPVPGALRLALTAGGALAFLLIGVQLFARLSDMPVRRDQYPVSAVHFAARHGLQGRMVVTYNWAQYVIASLADQHPAGATKVAFDGRFRTCYPQEVVDMHFDLILGDVGPRYRRRSMDSPPFAADRALQYGDPELVLLSRRQPHSQDVMRRRRREWVLLYQDELAQLWGRRSVFDDAASAKYFSPSLRRITDQPQIGSLTWPALPAKATTELAAVDALSRPSP